MATSSCPALQGQITLPSHVIDLAADELRRATGEHVDLRPRSFAVLRVLAENAGSLVTKNEITAKVWDDAAVTEDSLTQCIAEIRKAIGDEERRIVRTVTRRGYILTSSQQKESGPRAHHRPALAVLPFRSLSGNKETSLALGVASELLNELARNRDLRLIGRDSSFALGGQPAKAQELGEQLGAIWWRVRLSAPRTKSSLMCN
jgi:DNA-binding winged helix-turn-helix (wHTH) protein